MLSLWEMFENSIETFNLLASAFGVNLLYV